MEDRNGVYSNVGSSCGPTIYKLKWYWFWWWGENGVSDVEWCNVEINFTNYNTMYTIVKVCYFYISSPPCEEQFVASTSTEFRTLGCAQCHVSLFLKFTFETGNIHSSCFAKDCCCVVLKINLLLSFWKYIPMQQLGCKFGILMIGYYVPLYISPWYNWYETSKGHVCFHVSFFLFEPNTLYSHTWYTLSRH